MNKTVLRSFQISIIALVMVFAAGCQDTKAIDDVKAAAAKAQQDANAALTAANSAGKEASSAASAAAAAKSAADSAQTTANRALQTAQASQSCCDATNQKLDRMFKRSVSK
jgi:hypothetical protein